MYDDKVFKIFLIIAVSIVFIFVLYSLLAGILSLTDEVVLPILQKWSVLCSCGGGE